MSLQFICGRSGTGKSTYLYEKIKPLLNTKHKVYIIVPEQFSFTAERKLMEMTEGGSTVNAEVLTLSRMAHRVINEAQGLASKVILSDIGRKMLIYSIIAKNKSQLKFLSRNENHIEIALNALTELKKHGISHEMLNTQKENLEDKKLKLKLDDITLIYDKFEENIEGKYIDENDLLSILCKKLDKSHMFDNSYIFIDEFNGFTKQEYEIIGKLLQRVKKVTITICSDELECEKLEETDIFYTNKLTVSKLKNMASSLEIDLEDTVYLEENYRFQNEELQVLENGLYKQENSIFKDIPQNISLFLADNPYLEVEYAAKQIIGLVKNDKFRYRDISIIVKDIAMYAPLIKSIFNGYNIPVFIDEKKDLNQNILIQFILALLDIFTNFWSYESVMAYLKTGLLGISKEDIFEIENYCRKWGIRGKKWYSDNWKFEEASVEQEKINDLRIQIVSPLLQLKEKLVSKQTAFEISKAIYEFLLENHILENLNEKINNLKDEEMIKQYETSYNILIQVLDELALLFKDEKMAFEQYKNIFLCGIRASDLGVIPALQDQVTVGDIERTRSHKVLAVFILGMNDGNFPSVRKDEGFLNDKDREVLKNLEIELAKTTKEMMYEEQYQIYKALTTAEQKLFLTFHSSDSEGKTTRPSIMIMKIKKMFPKLKEVVEIVNQNDYLIKESLQEEAIKQYSRFMEGEEISDFWKKVICSMQNEENFQKAIKAFDDTNLPENLNEKNISRLYGNTIKTSISKLEQYQKCGFSYYLKYGLKLKPQKEFKIESIDTGNFMHEVIDSFFETLKEQELDVKTIDNETVEKIMNQIINEKLAISKYSRLTMTSKFRLLTKRLKKVLITSITYMIESIRNSDFELRGTEVEFSNHSKLKPITMETEDGKKIEIVGKIDRVDIAKIDGKNFVRIIDYKSSAKSIDLNQLVAGIQIQLITYMNELNEKASLEPAGVFYFNLIDFLIKSKRNLTDEEIKKEIKKKFKMQGLLISDIQIVKSMDHTLTTGYSNYIPVYLGKDGSISESRSNVIKEYDFKLIQKYIKKLIKEITKEILKGNISLNPYKKDNKTPCEYCEYQSICGFNTSLKDNHYNNIPSLTQIENLEKIKKTLE